MADRSSAVHAMLIVRLAPAPVTFYEGGITQTDCVAAAPGNVCIFATRTNLAGYAASLTVAERYAANKLSRSAAARAMLRSLT